MTDWRIPNIGFHIEYLVLVEWELVVLQGRSTERLYVSSQTGEVFCHNGRFMVIKVCMGSRLI